MPHHLYVCVHLVPGASWCLYRSHVPGTRSFAGERVGCLCISKAQCVYQQRIACEVVLTAPCWHVHCTAALRCRQRYSCRRVTAAAAVATPACQSLKPHRCCAYSAKDIPPFACVHSITRDSPRRPRPCRGRLPKCAGAFEGLCATPTALLRCLAHSQSFKGAEIPVCTAFGATQHVSTAAVPRGSTAHDLQQPQHACMLCSLRARLPAELAPAHTLQHTLGWLAGPLLGMDPHHLRSTTTATSAAAGVTAAAGWQH
jgi:hypothetical protein